MSTTVAVQNIGLRPFAVKTMGTIAANPAVTKTAVRKQVVADDFSTNFDKAAKFGVYITENGTARPGSVEHNATANIATTTHLALVDMTGNITLTLPALASVPDGHRITVYLRSASAGTLTIDGDGAETVLGAADQTATAAGYVLRIRKNAKVSATDWVAATV